MTPCNTPKLRHIIINRHGLSIVIEVAVQAGQAKGLAFIHHGVSGYKEQQQIQKICDVFYQNDYHVVTFDGTHSFGESGGSLINFTATTHIEDLEDVIQWTASQAFYVEPFVLAGTSMGGFSSMMYAIRQPDKVKALAPISTATAGKHLAASYQEKDPVEFATWQKNGSIPKSHRYNPAIKGDLSWRFLEDFSQYDIFDHLDRIKVPMLLVVGEHDRTVRIEQQKELYEALTMQKELHIIPGSGHTFIEPHELNVLGRHLDLWIKKIT